jgi:hypothetical protein
MAISQKVVVFVDQTTLTALKSLGYALYALKGFETTNAQGKALVWGETTGFADTTTFISTGEYQAFVTTSTEVGGNVVTTRAVAAVTLGDIATFTLANGLTVTPGGNPAGVTIVNSTTTPYTAGLSARSMDAGGDFSPVASVPLYGLSEDIIAPVDKFLVTFSTAGAPVGTPFPHSVTQSLLIDMTDQTLLEATFDINTGWSFGDAAWGETVPAGADLFAVLVKETPLLSQD